MDKLVIEKKTYIHASLNQCFDYGQLIIPLQGMVTFETQSKRLCDGEQKILLIPPNCKYSFTSDSCRAYLVMKIPAEMFSDDDLRKLSGGFTLALDNRWMAIRTLLLEEIYTGVDETNLKSLFKYIYQFISEEKSYVSVEYIKDHYDGPIDIKTLAKLEGYNVAYYSEWFKKRMGMKPKEYIQKVRLEKAKDLLIETDYSIMQIALMVGYHHHGSLTRVFKIAFGMSPAQFRKKHVDKGE